MKQIKKLGIILFLCITASAVAQNSIGISYSFLNSSPFTNASLYTPKADPGYLITLNTSFLVRDKIRLECGISFSHQSIVWGENIPNTFVEGFYDIFRTYEHNPAVIEFVRWKESYSAVNLPINFHYHFFNTKNSSFYIGGGISVGFLLERINEVRYTNGRSDSKRNTSSDIIGGTNINLGYQFLFSEYLGFSMNANYLFEIYPKEGKRDLIFKSFGFGGGIIVLFPASSLE